MCTSAAPATWLSASAGVVENSLAVDCGLSRAGRSSIIKLCSLHTTTTM
jgi:hypothetical protein